MRASHENQQRILEFIKSEIEELNMKRQSEVLGGR